jgi:molybdate transport system ATP-binding protein
VSVDATVSIRLDRFDLDVSLQVAEEETVAVLGPNGAGKTTLLRALAGLIPIDAGRVVLDGDVVDDPAAGVFVAPERRGVGVVFQDYLLFPHLDALDNVAFGLREHGLRRSDARAQATKMLTGVGLADHLHARPAQLSGGQAQRVALARAVAVEPRVLLLDEPLAALDVQTRVEVRAALRSVFSNTRAARVLVTHDALDALTLADRLCILQDGKVVQTGTAEEVVAQPRTAYVAELVGTNLYRGDATGATVRLERGSAQLATASEHSGAVFAVVPPSAVVLHRHRPEGSARNVFAGSVTSIDRFGTRVRVRVDGALPVVAEVTPAAVTELDLRDGTPVWVAIKATEVSVFPA